MSLIADALKTAQADAVRENGSVGHLSGRGLASSVLHRRAVPARRQTSGLRKRIPRQVGMAAAVFGVALMAAGAVVSLAPSRQAPIAAAASAPSRSESDLPVTTPMPESAAPEAALGLASASETSDWPARTAETVPKIDAPVGPAPRRETGPAAEPARAPAAAPRLASASRERGTAERFRLTVEPARASTEDLFSAAIRAQRSGDLLMAARLYQELARQNPGNAVALNNLGAVYQALGDSQRARDAFRQAVAANARDAAAWSNLGAVLGTLGDDAGAESALGEAIRLDASNNGARVNLANHFLTKGLLPDARRLLEEVVRAQPAHAEAHYGLGRVLEAQGTPSQAVGHYRTFLQNAAGRFPELENLVRRRVEQLSPS